MAVKFGSKFSLLNLTLLNHLRYVWDPVKAPEGWVAVVKPGKVLFEISGVSEEVAREALRLASHKLPIKTKFVKREEIGGESNES